MAKKQSKTAGYTATRQLIYPHADTGAEIIVEVGGAVENLSAESLALELEAGNVVDASVQTESTTEEQT